jgi:hypothetical protein
MTAMHLKQQGWHSRMLVQKRRYGCTGSKATPQENRSVWELLFIRTLSKQKDGSDPPEKAGGV